MNQKNGAKNIWTIQKVSLDEKEKTKRIQINQRGLVDDIRILATINSDACYVDSNIVWTNYFEMSITGLISGIVMLIAPTEEVNIASKIYKGAILTDKVIQKTEEGTWGASAHEEGYQITKDSILKMGGLK